MSFRYGSTEQVRDAALAVLGTAMGEILGPERAARLVRAREAVAGAIFHLAASPPSNVEVAAAMGWKNVGSVRYMILRYDREWPGAIRELWESSVLIELGARQPGGPAPGARSRPLDGGPLHRWSARSRPHAPVAEGKPRRDQP